MAEEPLSSLSEVKGSSSFSQVDGMNTILSFSFSRRSVRLCSVSELVCVQRPEISTFYFLLCPMLSNLLRAVAELIDSLPERTLLTLLLAFVPLALVYLYRRFLHIPFAERAVKIVWIAPEEAT